MSGYVHPAEQLRRERVANHHREQALRKQLRSVAMDKALLREQIRKLKGQRPARPVTPTTISADEARRNQAILTREVAAWDRERLARGELAHDRMKARVP